MPDHSRDDRSTSGMLLAVALVVVSVALLIAASVFATSSGTDDRPAAQQTVPTPTTTMSPVQPADEAATPPAAASAATSGVSPAWVQRVARASGISSTAVDAYGAISLRMGRDQPSCRLGWTTLAGIGRIESGHGTNDGSTLRSDGTTSRRILGPALDGSAGLASIPSDDESVRWHDDETWDHAMGPMQFIPSTWEKWESDGNDDGILDPHNIYDAAYAAGRYLCASGADLTTGAGWTRAVFSYNHSDDYVRSVLAGADDYAALAGS